MGSRLKEYTKECKIEVKDQDLICGIGKRTVFLFVPPYSHFQK